MADLEVHCSANSDGLVALMMWGTALWLLSRLF
jgi:hypothetical protein